MKIKRRNKKKKNKKRRRLNKKSKKEIGTDHSISIDSQSFTIIILFK